ncbi:hypothetical protein GW17_00027403 [Ensete ventricosum]|nr:hypothetical protein GW17_00027403 [Ensete ventricosum]RZR80100.1 hypothetical protein BHM03_00006018 [Ensete ventricosum]
MDPEFQFDGASSDEGAGVEERAAQSPWEFASYSESVAEEHARRNTTSIDAKITRALQERAVSLPDDGDGEEVEEEEPEPEPGDEVLSGDELGKQRLISFEGKIVRHINHQNVGFIVSRIRNISMEIVAVAQISVV